MTHDRNYNWSRIGVVASAAVLAMAVLVPSTAVADQSGNAGGNASERAGNKGGDRGQQGLDNAREAGGTFT